MTTRQISVLKIGGSVLTGRQAFGGVASCVRDRLNAHPGERLVVIVSA